MCYVIPHYKIPGSPTKRFSRNFLIIVDTVRVIPPGLGLVVEDRPIELSCNSY